MQAPDLRIGPPRRWNESLDGVIWLPRLIDKARAALCGTLGSYLFGQSPIDREMLNALGMGHRAFADIIALAADDDAVIAAIERRDPQAIERARGWGRTTGRLHRFFFAILDIDDGYTLWLRPVRSLVTVPANALTWAMKRIWPADFTRGNTSTLTNTKAP